MTLPVDLKSQDFFRDPSATVKRLQAAGPVVEVKLPFVGRVWMTTTQEMASRVLKDGKLFTMRKDDGDVAAMRWWMPRIFRVLTNHMLTVDEPDHTRLRSIVDEAFRRRSVAGRRSRWSRTSARSPTSSPVICLRRPARPTSSPDMRDSSPCG